MYIQKVKDLLYSGQKVNVDLAISIMDGLWLTWTSAGFEEEKELVDLCGVDVFCELNINLRYNQLSSLPESIGQLQKIEWLVLSHNQIKALPVSIGQLQQLVELDLSDNQLKALPPSIGQLQQLKVLWLGGNQLKALPSSISQLQKIEMVSLSDNKLETLPPSIGQLQNIKKLWLNGNPLSQSEIDKVKALLPNCNIYA